MLLLWAILFIILAIACGIFAFGGIAVAVSFFTKLLFIVSFTCFLVALVLIVIEKIQTRKKKIR